MAKLNNDAALAVAEDAFRKGYEAGIATAERNDSADWWHAWSNYAPSEEIKELVD